MPQPLASKEQTLFRSLVKHYEGKQYKKGLKAAEQILKKHPNHGDTQAMKALILNSQHQGDEAFALCKVALKNDMKSHICWHVYGLLWRSVKNYEEAIKAYKFALRIEPSSVNILRDLALLQCQIRDYEGYIESRRKMMQDRPQLRQNWTAVAVAYHLAGSLTEAENILATYEGTLKQTPPKTDLEHSEAVLYKNTIIAESGDIERALEQLDEVARVSLDRTAALELRAQYLLKLGRNEEAEKAYRVLLDRNSEYRANFDGLEKSLGLDRTNEGDIEKLKELYESFATKNERNDAARRVPLDFLGGEDFKTAADQYLRRKLNKGVPSTFPNIKALYQDPRKQKVIEELVLGYANDKTMNGSAESQTNGGTSDRFEESVLYFLVQHYDYIRSRDLGKAEKYIDQLLEKNEKSVDYNQIKARIHKHAGNVQKAAEIMNHARELDERDRYINTKCAKYQLRNNENELALKTMSKFTRNETVGGPLGDLHEMQCMWFLLEDGKSYERQQKWGLALKRFTAVADIFDVWYEDQFDFHSFSLRKGQIRAYIDMVRWEDHLRNHPFFTKAAIEAVKIYLRLADNPQLSKSHLLDLAKLDPVERKKAEKKAKKDKEKAEAERKATAAAKPTAKGDDVEAKKEDADPNGEELLQTSEPLEASLRFLLPMLELSPQNVEAQSTGFEVYIRRKKYLLALKCLNSIRDIDPDYPRLHEQRIRLRQAFTKLSEPSPQAAQVIQASFTEPVADADLNKYNEDFMKKHSNSVSHLHSAYNARYALDNSTKAQNEKDLTKTLAIPDITIDQAKEGLTLLEEWKSDEKVVEDYRVKAASRWSQAGIFKKH